MSNGAFEDLQRDYDGLRQAVLTYLREVDNPAPDYSYRRVLRNKMREVADAPPEPKRT